LNHIEEFNLIVKALNSTKKTIEQDLVGSPTAINQLSQAKEEMIKALSYASSVDHHLIIDTMFDE